MGATVRWAEFGGFSGPYIRGVMAYHPPKNPTGFDLIVATIARPEGGAYDTVVMYDGTAVTYGLLQWTFTSGRLHKLLAFTRAGWPGFDTLFHDELERVSGLRISDKNGDLLLRGKKVVDFHTLRNVCTPPDGRCPKSGPGWEKASKIAHLFSTLGKDLMAQMCQIDFFWQELLREIGLKRPKLGGRTIASYLYPSGFEAPDLSRKPYLATIRALFFGAWQNSPRKAEEYLHLAFHDYRGDLDSKYAVELFARKIAFTSFARWGVEKAKEAAKPYTSRYQKMAEEINSIFGVVMAPEYWK